jgi:sialic acid synthase SpsE
MRLIKDCLVAGADAVKLQLFNEDTIKDYEPKLRERLTPMILTLADLNTISVFVHANGGELIVTPMYPGAMDILAKMKPFPCDGFKVRGKDFTNLPLLKEIVSKAGDKPVYVSVPHDAEGNVPSVADGTYQTICSSNCSIIYCRPEYPPKLNTLNLYKSLMSNFSGISIHSNDWTVHAAACAFHIGHEEQRPHEHIRRYYCEVHVMPVPGVPFEISYGLGSGEEASITAIPEGYMKFNNPLDEAVSLVPEDLEKLAKAIKMMETAIG